MKKVVLYSVAIFFLISCGEELISKPENLISKEKMADIIQEFAIVNAAKTTNSAIFRQNNIDPTEYVLAKFDIDSIEYVESDRYYVSKPAEYEKIFKIVEKRLETDAKAMSVAKRKSDSLRLKKQREEAELLQKQKKLKKDSLP